MDLRVLISTAILLVMSGRTTLARQSTVSDRTSQQFFLLDLDGFGIASPLSLLPAVSASQCVLVCLRTTGCTSVAMSGGLCITFDGTVITDAHALYDVAYDSRDMSQRCPPPFQAANMEVLHIYPFPQGEATLSCAPGYVGHSTTLMAGHFCEWIGLQPPCYKCYEWMTNCYFFNPTGMSWQTAKDECESYGGWLADINSQEENNFLVQTMNQLKGPSPVNDAFWIGGKRHDDSDVFTWYHSNQALIFDNFYGSEPQNSLNEHCLGLFNKTGWNYGWGNAGCNRPQGYLCKVAMPL